jgi:hypothetical protein
MYQYPDTQIRDGMSDFYGSAGQAFPTLGDKEIIGEEFRVLVICLVQRTGS